MRNYFRALAFLTVMPLPFVQFDSNGKDLASSAAAFPLVGITLGLIYTLLALLLGKVFPHLVIVVLVLSASFFLTRGLHYDGLADTADGLIGTTNREKALKAMKDSAVGVMGTVAILLVTLMKIAFLLEFRQPLLLALGLVFMSMSGRWVMVLIGTFQHPVNDCGLGCLFLNGLNLRIFFKASLSGIIAVALLAWFAAEYLVPIIIGIIAAFSICFLLVNRISKRLDGITGDVLGAACELGELFFLAGYFTAVNLSGKLVSLFEAVI